VRVATGKRHVFRRLGVPAKFRLQFLDDDGKPRAGVAWSLDIGGRKWSGTTDAEGRLDIFVPNDARAGTLLLGQDEEIDLAFGGMDPLDSASGVARRLGNLGFGSLREFQKRTGLTVTGQLDDATRAKLAELHDTSATW
jgi:hypothetical protein